MKKYYFFYPNYSTIYYVIAGVLFGIAGIGLLADDIHAGVVFAMVALSISAIITLAWALFSERMRMEIDTKKQEIYIVHSNFIKRVKFQDIIRVDFYDSQPSTISFSMTGKGFKKHFQYLRHNKKRLTKEIEDELNEIKSLLKSSAKGELDSIEKEKIDIPTTGKKKFRFYLPAVHIKKFVLLAILIGLIVIKIYSEQLGDILTVCVGVIAIFVWIVVQHNMRVEFDFERKELYIFNLSVKRKIKFEDISYLEIVDYSDMAFGVIFQTNDFKDDFEYTKFLKKAKTQDRLNEITKLKALLMNVSIESKHIKLKNLKAKSQE